MLIKHCQGGYQFSPLNSEQNLTKDLYEIFQDETRSESWRLKQLLSSRNALQSERNGDGNCNGELTILHISALH